MSSHPEACVHVVPPVPDEEEEEEADGVPVDPVDPPSPPLVSNTLKFCVQAKGRRPPKASRERA
jgi:hypothetical protein